MAASKRCAVTSTPWTVELASTLATSTSGTGTATCGLTGSCTLLSTVAILSIAVAQKCKSMKGWLDSDPTSIIRQGDVVCVSNLLLFLCGGRLFRCF